MRKKLIISTLMFLGGLTAPAMAADIARDVLDAGDSTGGYVELGFALIAGSLPLVGFNDRNLEDSGDTIGSLGITLEGRIQYKSIFIEAVEHSFSNITLGYSFYDNENSGLELVVANHYQNLERNDVAGLETIRDRKGDANLGFRYSRNLGGLTAQAELTSDVVNSHHGISGAFHLGRQQQVMNWNLHGLVGLRYFSDDVLDHLMGISAEEATADYPEYRADDGFMPSVQLGATLPLTEKWIFKSIASYTKFPDSIASSPLAQDDWMYFAQVGVSYVFGN